MADMTATPVGERPKRQKHCATSRVARRTRPRRVQLLHACPDLAVESRSGLLAADEVRQLQLLR